MKSAVNKLLSILAICSMLLATLPACTGEEESSDEETNERPSENKKSNEDYYKIKKVDVSPEIDAKMAAAGKEIFETKCSACHKYDERYVGPPLGKVTERRTPEYVMNMILYPETMQQNDDTVKSLVQTFLIQMPNQSLSESEARNVLEHLRSYTRKN